MMSMDSVKMVDTNGKIHNLDKLQVRFRLINVNITSIISQVRVMMAVGWMAFLGSWLMNILFYKVHPSAVDCSMKGVREKLFIHVQGKKRFLWGYRDAKGEK